MSRLRLSHLIAALAVLVLLIYGVSFIYSAGKIGADLPVRSNWLKQLLFIAIGSAGALCIANWDNRRLSWRFFVLTGYGVTILLLAVVLVAGKEIGGARRWLPIGGFLLQPAEFARVFTILMGAWILSGDSIRRRWLQFCTLIAVFALPFLLILLEPSYGNAGSLLPCLAVLIGVNFVPRGLFRWGAATAAVLLIAGAVGVHIMRTLPPEPRQALLSPAENTGIFRGYHLRRLHSFLSSDGGWNERQSLMAVGSGGITGKGYLDGSMKNLGYLPRTVAPTDFIFAVIAEEGGFLFGALPVMTLYLLLIGVAMHWATMAANRLDANILFTGTTLVVVHILVGVGMTIRMIPVIGLPLPLLSYGGSFTLAMLMLFGAMAGAVHTPEDGADSQSSTASKSESLLRFGDVLQLRIRRRR